MTSPRSDTPDQPRNGSPAAARTPGTLVVLDGTAHRVLLGAGLLGAVLFPVVYFVDGALRPGYDALAEPISALALGPVAGVQIANFIAFGVLTAISAIGWRTTLAPGPAAVGYPALRVVTGLALIATGIFHEGVGHNVASYTSLVATVIGLLVLSRRLHRAPAWPGWAAYAVLSAVLMMGFLATYGALVAHGGGGVFEKLATITGSLFTLALTTRTLTRRSWAVDR